MRKDSRASLVLVKHLPEAILFAALVFAGPACASGINDLPVKKSGKIGGEVTVTYELDVPAPVGATRECSAEIEIAYSQLNDKVRVETVVINQDCAASHGEYSVQLYTRDNAGNSDVHSFDEAWARDTATDIENSKDYEIGEDVELIRARINRVSCVCALPEEPAE